MHDPMIRGDPKRIQHARKGRVREDGKPTTQDNLLELLDRAGVSIKKRTLEAIEATGHVRRSVLQTIADVLDVPYDSLLADGVLPWTIQSPTWNPETCSPGLLLQAEQRIVPFH